MMVAAAHLLALLLSCVSAQTWTRCNPTQGSCPADTALGMSIDVDFTKGAVNSFASSGSPTYSSSNGVAFTVSRTGDAPQLASLFYIMFGRVEMTMRAAPGAGIVSSLVLQSDDLDEIDVEWLGASPDQLQSNYFSKGRTTTYNRGQFHDVARTQADWIKYTVDWTPDRIVWMAGDTVLRTLTRRDAGDDNYPQTPMQVKFGAWAAGDPSNNAPGTVKWAMGPTDYSKGPFTMTVRNLLVADYSTGKEYVYEDTSGSWQSIRAVGGTVNGNAGDGRPRVVVATPTLAPVPVQLPVPVGGIGRDESAATATQTGWPWVAGATPVAGSIPSGWHMTSEGKIMRDSSAAATLLPCVAALSAPLLAGALLFVAF